MGKGSNTTTTASNSASSTSPDSNAYQAYQALLQRASGVASTPYQGYTGEQVAPINEQQQAGIGAINTQQGAITATGAPLSAADIQRYQDPYTQSVIDATQHDFDVQNQRGLSNVTGNAAAKGALGGDRVEVAKALANESASRTQNPIIANLRSQGYQNAVKTAEGQQQQALRAGVAGLQGAQAMVGAGTLEQQTQQAQDTQGRLDYYQQQGYPFQVAQWLAQIDTGVGSQMGGTSTSTGTTTKTPPTPNPWTQVAGLGLTAAGMFANRGGRISGVHSFARGGAADDDIDGFALGGMPWSGEAQSWVPQVSGIAAGRGAPQAPSFVQAAGDDKAPGLSKDQMKGIGAIGKSASGLDWGGMFSSLGGGDGLSGDSWGGGSFGKGDAYGGSSASPLPGLSPDDYGMSRGGRIRRYANGGYAFGGSPDEDTSFDERFSAAYPNRVVAGVGASRPAFSVVNPDEPYRMPPPEAVESWRSGVDRDIGVGVTEQPKGGEPVELPPEVISGRTKPAPVTEDEPAEAMSYAGRPRMVSGVGASPAAPEAPDESFLGRLGVKVTPELKSGLLQAGLAMMATRHGGPGSFLQSAGEAGMAGVGAYNQTAQNALDQAEKLRKEGFEREKFERPYSEMTAAQKAADKRAKEAADRERVPSGYRIGKDGNLEYIKGGPEDPDRISEKEKAKKSSEGGLSDAGVEVAARQAAMGDQSWAKNIGRGAQSAKDVTKVRNRLSDILINERGMQPAEAAKFVAEASRSWAASQIAENAGARTRANRVANLDMILEVADSAVPATLEMSAKLPRGQWVPINKIIQKGQVMTSNPALAEFGVANLQLAEGWARAMNPTGVMRESDRDKALEFLSTATSPETYERVVKQIQKQIHREKDAISKGHSPKEITTTAGDMPSPKAIEMLNSDPGKYKEDFERRYGKGAADRFLGK